MIENLGALKIIFESLGKLKKAFEGLEASNLFIQETDIYDLIEKYFALEPLPKKKIKIIGRLSNYTLNNSVPIYTPAHLKTIRQTVRKEFLQEEQKFADKVELELKAMALNIPSISYLPIELPDKTTVKILWLYPEDCCGLVFNPIEKIKLDRNNLCDLFGIENKDKPIPILVNIDFPNEYLYKTVEIIGSVYTSPIELFKQFTPETDSFILNYFSNFFRPFSSQDGILAIDARTSIGNVKILTENLNPFKIIYTVQAIVELPVNVEDKYSQDIMMNELIDSIPDRQGLGQIRSMGDASNDSVSIVTLGETCWQSDKQNSGIAAFKEINLTDKSYNQANLSELANNWQVWQKTARKRIREKFNNEISIKPLVCSNPKHEKTFHPNGLQISKSLEDKLLNENPEIRKSIDWLGISTGKE